MWSDNETDVDLLGFDFLVDELVVALTSQQLLPLTVGVLGEWGSGKSSLLEMTRLELDKSADPKILTVAFSPWQYEDYDDVKLALMRAVLDACEGVLEDSSKIKGLKRFLGVLSAFGKQSLRAGLRAAPGVATALVAADPNVDPTTVAILNSGVTAATGVLSDRLEEAEDELGEAAVTSLSAFRAKFEEMTDDLPVASVVVFIDDLDRCLPNSVVDTFEAIRLFLNTPKMAFVVAVHRQIAEAAIDAAFPEYGRQNVSSLGHDYLEKMLQVQLVVPKPSVEDIETYVGLLQAKLHLEENDYIELCRKVVARRHAAPFSKPFSMTTASEDLADKLTVDLRRDITWGTQVVPAIGGALRGNPRQIKRFLNDIKLREAAAKRRGAVLEPEVLAKLQALYEMDPDAFQRLFDWQNQANGKNAELQIVESGSRTGIAVAKPEPAPTASRKSSSAAKLSVVDPADAVAAWGARPAVQRWMTIDPPLGEIDLRPYFNYFRSNLVVGTGVSALAEHLKALVDRLTAEVDSVRRLAADEFVKLEMKDQGEVWDVVEANFRERPDSIWWDAAGDIASRSPLHGQALIAVLTTMSDRVIPAARVLGMTKRLPAGMERDALLEKWRASSVGGLSAIAGVAQRATNS